jgi:glycosyltransferase involved in cell wall biosynthesis
MRIATANNHYYTRGGCERVLFDEERMLRERGHAVLPFSIRRDANPPCATEKYFVKGLDLEHCSAMRKLRAVSTLVHNRAAGKAFGRLLDDLQPQIVHAHNIYGGLTTSVLRAAQRRGVPLVMTLHDYKLVCPSYLMLSRGRACELCLGGRFRHCFLQGCHKNSRAASLVYTAESYVNKWFGRYDAVRAFLCPSRFLMHQHLRAGFSQDRLIHVPNPIDTDAYLPDYDQGAFALFAGRLSHEKGLSTLLQAFRGLDVPLRVVGTGPMEDELKSFAGEHSMGNVAFEGYRTGEELRHLFRSAAFVVVPSEWHENAPLSILEAFAYGKPVIGADIGGIPEMVVHDRTGLLFQPGRVGDLRECVKQLWVQAPRRTELGRAARAFVEAEHSSESHYRQLLGIYERVVR